jgi:hypothetical protein
MIRAESAVVVENRAGAMVGMTTHLPGDLTIREVLRSNAANLRRCFIHNTSPMEMHWARECAQRPGDGSHD